MADFTTLVNRVIIASFMLLVLVSVLGSLDPTLSAELNNTAAHPNGPLTLIIVGFFGLAVAIRIFTSIFEQGKERIQDFRGG